MHALVLIPGTFMDQSSLKNLDLGKSELWHIHLDAFNGLQLSLLTLKF